MAIAIESVVQVKDSTMTQQSLTGELIFRVNFSYTTLDELDDYPALSFLCMTATDPNTALAIPLFNSQYSGDLVTFVEDINSVINKNQQSEWLVTVTYAPLDDQDDSVSSDPTTDEISYDWVEVLEKEKIWRDANNVPIVTSSGGSFTSLPQIDNAYLSCTVSRNENAYDPDDALAIINHINDDVFSIDGNSYPAGFVKCKGWRGSKRTVKVAGAGTVTYHSESLIFLIKDEIWFGRVFDQDTWYLAAMDTAGLPAGRSPIMKGGEIVTRPQPLNGAGLPIYDNGQSTIINAITPVAYDFGAPAAGVESLAGGTVAMLTFQFWKEADFGITGVT